MERFANLAELCQKLGLAKLYFIKEYPNLLLFGARANELATDWLAVSQGIAIFINQPAESVIVLSNAYDEVAILLKEVDPYVEADGGHLDINSVDEPSGKVVLSMKGACSGCPSSIYTLKAGIERLLEEHLPWVKSVDSDQPPSEPNFGFDLGGEGGA